MVRWMDATDHKPTSRRGGADGRVYTLTWGTNLCPTSIVSDHLRAVPVVVFYGSSVLVSQTASASDSAVTISVAPPFSMTGRCVIILFELGSLTPSFPSTTAAAVTVQWETVLLVAVFMVQIPPPPPQDLTSEVDGAFRFTDGTTTTRHDV